MREAKGAAAQSTRRRTDASGLERHRHQAPAPAGGPCPPAEAGERRRARRSRRSKTGGGWQGNPGCGGRDGHGAQGDP
eukprot:8167152-Pyramimonas_sp.AAC.1